MGGVKQRAIEMDAVGLTHTKDTHVCYRHINDYAIEAFIKENAENGYCDYCKRKRKVVEFETMMKFIMGGIMEFYEDAAEFMRYESSEGGYQGTIYDPQELIDDEVNLQITNDDLREHIIDCIDDRAWSDPTTYYESSRQILGYLWNYFKDIVKHRSRYMFAKTTKLKSFSYEQNAYGIMDDIGERVHTFGLIKALPKKTVIYRCRQHEADEDIDDASKIASPPAASAKYANRMSPAGISMFYGAFDAATAKAETIDETIIKERPKLSTAVFTNNESLNMIDLTELPPIPSIFDQEKRSEIYSIGFLWDFVADLSAPIKHDGMEHIEYIPTQVVTEYFRYVFDSKDGKEIDGIIYPSSRKKNGKACVFFIDNDECIERLKFLKDELTTENLNEKV